MRYGKASGWLYGQPAVITHWYGRERITYIGAVLDDKLMSAAAQWVVQKSGVVPALGPRPDGIGVCRREGARGSGFIVINFLQTPQHVALTGSMKALLGGGDVSSGDLPAYGVEVLLEADNP